MSFDPQLMPAEGQEAAAAPPSLPNPDIDYNVRLSEDRARALGQRVKIELAAYEQATARKRQNARVWRDDYEVVQADLEGPWPNSADLRAPFTNIACSNHSTRLNSQFLGVNPLFGAKSSDPKAAPWTQGIEDLMTCKLREAGFEQCFRDLSSDLPIVSDCLWRTMWVKETRRMPKHTVEFDEDQFQLAAETTGDAVGAFNYALDTKPDGTPKYKLEFEEQTLRDGLEYRVIPFEESIVLPPTAKRDEDLWALGEWLYLRGLDLEKGAKEGRYRKKAVDELLRGGVNASTRSEDEVRRDLAAGIDTEGYVPQEARYADYRCAMLDWWDDLNGDGECEWYWLLVEERTGLVLQCMFSPYEHGESRYDRFPYITRTAQLFSASIAERLAALQDGATTSLNDILNISDQIVGMAGNFIHDSRAMLTPSKIRIGPGIPLYVPGSIEGIRPMSEEFATLPGALQALLLVLDKLKEFADLVSATSNPALGRETDGDKTLGEVRLVLGNAQQIFSDLAQGVGIRIAKVCDKSRWLVAQYGSENGVVKYAKTASPGATVQVQDPMTGEPSQVPGVQVWAPGPDGQPMQQAIPGQMGEGQIPAEVLRAQVDFEPLGISGLPDAGSRLQRDILVMQQAITNPVIAGMPNVLAKMFKQVVQDSQFPQHDNINADIDQGLEQMQMMQAVQAQLALQSGLQQGQQMQQQGQMAQEAHASQMATQQQGRDQQDLATLGAVPNPNSAKNGAAGK